MNHYHQVDYSGGWNNQHDQRLQQQVQQVFQRYDKNHSQQLEGEEFFHAYRDLCLQMGMAPPNSYQEVWQAAQQIDQNRDGKVSPQEMMTLFKNIQGVQQQGGQQQGWGGQQQGGQQGFGGGGHQGGQQGWGNPGGQMPGGWGGQQQGFGGGQQGW